MSKPEHQVALLLKQLGKIERTPRKLVETWQETSQQQASSTARIFLDEGGIPSWLAYLVTKNAAEGNYHFAGKADCVRLIAELENETVETRVSLVKDLALEIDRAPPEKLDTYVKRVTDATMSQNQNKRQRK